MAPHIPSILSAIASGAAHPSPVVQTAALAAVEPLLPYVTDALVPSFHQLMGALLPCAEAAVASGNEELLVQLCQVWRWWDVVVVGCTGGRGGDTGVKHGG
jgi:hypothetical protein